MGDDQFSLTCAFAAIGEYMVSFKCATTFSDASLGLQFWVFRLNPTFQESDAGFLVGGRFWAK